MREHRKSEFVSILGNVVQVKTLTHMERMKIQGKKEAEMGQAPDTL